MCNAHLLRTTKKITRVQYLLVFLLVLVSGSMYLSQPIVFGLFGGGAFIYSLFRKDVNKRNQLWKFLLLIVIVFFIQFIVLHFISFLGCLNVLAKIVFGATVMWLLKEKFRVAYLNVMYFFSAISLLFFFLSYIGFIVPNLFPTVESRSSILFYNHIVNPILDRNCGPFWEPGAFACYLILVPILYIDNLKEFYLQNRKKVIVLFIALITTYSTTGFICLAVIILYYLSTSKRKILTYTLVLPVALFFMYNVYTSNEFLGDKIESQFDKSQDLDGDFSNTRMGSFMFDLHYIKKHPLIGNGLHERTRYADHPYLWGNSPGHGNGFSNFLVQMGLLVTSFYFFLIYHKLGRNRQQKVIALFVLFLLLQGEQVLNYPLFLSLPFIIIQRKKYESSMVVC